MKKHKNRLKNGLSFWCIVYPFGVFVGIMMTSLRILGWLKIRGLEKFPRHEKSVLLVANHPSLWEPIILAGLFFPSYIFHPIRQMPWGTPDKKNYEDKWYWNLLSSRFISVPRGVRRGEFRALVEVIKVLRVGGNVVLHVEGGRTAKGDKFLHSQSGKRMRELKPGVGRVICRTKCCTVPVWVDGSENVLPIGSWFPRVWRGMTVTVGEPFIQNHPSKPKKRDFEVANKRVAQALLTTAG